MNSFIKTYISRTKTFILYGNLKDIIWCPDLMPRDIEHYLVMLLKNEGYKHIVFFGAAGTKGVYCLDEESARFFYSENIDVPLAEPMTLDSELHEPVHSESESDSDSDSAESGTGGTGSQVSDALDVLFGDVDEDEYRPGSYSSTARNEQQETVPSENERRNAMADRKVRYAYRNQVMSEFLQKIHPLMLKEDSHMAVVFYNILTTEMNDPNLRDDILSVWEMNSKGNICFLLFPETSENESALENKIRQANLDSKFFRRSHDRDRIGLNPLNCIKIGGPGKDEVQNMLRYLTIVGNENGRKLDFRYCELNMLAEYICLQSKKVNNKKRLEYEYMTELYKRFSDFLDQQDLNERIGLTTEMIDKIYGATKASLPTQKKDMERQKSKADWVVERVAVVPEVLEDDESLEDLMKKLDSMTGLTKVKEEVKQQIAIQSMNLKRRSQGLSEVSPSRHMVFTGAPGTGKTTIARLIGRIYRKLGILSTGQFVEAQKQDLVAGYVGQTAIKTKEIIENAKGGVLFIDEAYSLSASDQGAFGQEAIDTLLKSMEDFRDDLVVIVAGYEDEMKSFINSNPGLKSRFNTYIHFDNYTEEELMQILAGLCTDNGFTMDDAAREKALKIIKVGKRFGGRRFGNGRYVRNAFEDACGRMALRLANEDAAENMSCFVESDFEIPSGVDATLNDLEVDKREEELLEELDQMIGLKEVKKNIREIVDLQKYNNLRKLKGFPANAQSLHMVFSGNPGTGKTEVAKLVGRILRAIGMLSNGSFKAVKREDLVGTHVGDTEEKTRKILEEAKGGVLFIDEAYALAGGEQDFGTRAIEVLLTFMDENRDDLVVIVAGYVDEMDKFIQANPGLKSRFTQFVSFDDYSTDELVEILRLFADKEGYVITDGALKKAKQILERGKNAGGKDFGNGRFARNVFEAAVRHLASRVSHNQIVDQKDMFTLYEEDFEIQSNLRNSAIEEKTTEQLLDELDRMIGLDEVKKMVRSLIKNEQAKKLRKEKGLSVPDSSLQFVFSGNPGTGKTTVARLLGKLLKSIGVLPSGHLVEAGRDKLVAGYIGQSEEKTTKALNEARGGILFIDEAYSLTNTGSDNDYGKVVVDTIVKYMEDNRNTTSIIVAGYKREMEQFLEVNPGLKSRFNIYLDFSDYSHNQLLEILEKLCNENDYILSDDAKKTAGERLKRERKKQSYSFGNGRVVRNLFEEAMRNQGNRVAEIDDPSMEDLKTFLGVDFQQ